jgi:hypothetical protein
MWGINGASGVLATTQSEANGFASEERDPRMGSRDDVIESVGFAD